MLNVSTAVALEIFANPYDLVIIIGKDDVGSDYLFRIFRGHTSNFRMVFGTESMFVKKEDAEKEIKDVLEFILITGKKELEDPKGLIFQARDLEDRGIQRLPNLNSDLINRISEEFKNHRSVRTYEL